MLVRWPMASSLEVHSWMRWVATASRLWVDFCRRFAPHLTKNEIAVHAWIALGSNLGDRAGHLNFARQSLTGAPEIVDLVAGAVDETPPLGGLDQPPYLNQMLRITTTMDPRILLHVCHEIEKGAGRVREARWCSRTLDLDLVRFGDAMCDLPELTLPHPGLRDRTFWARQIAALETHG